MFKKINKFLKKYFGEILTVVGSGIFSYNVLNFSYRTSSGGLLSFRTEIDGVAYYFSNNTLSWIAIGVMLVVGGVLIIKNKNN